MNYINKNSYRDGSTAVRASKVEGELCIKTLLPLKRKRVPDVMSAPSFNQLMPPSALPPLPLYIFVPAY